jgi:hypothetical protein
MRQRDRQLSSLGAILFILFALVEFQASLAQSGASAVEVVQVNLDRLIDAAAKDRNRFAVDIPHVINASQAGMGTWSVTRGVATWRYSVRVPTAVSLSFHATNIFLPPSAQLKVLGGGNTYIYSAKDTNRRQLWSRISKGDSLTMELTVAPKERRSVVLQIASMQAGYRGFGHAVPDHPYYVRLRKQAMAASTSSCIVNYECDVTAANTAPGQATVALIVGNAFQCSGTLINDVPHDGKPYVLTARHCENGQPGGGYPGAAANVVVYWDATSPCGSALGTLYDPGIVTQQGATTVVEQQDAWLLLLTLPPAASDAYLAGFDATGGVIQGGYTIHQSLSNDKQFTAWNGQAIAQTVAANTSLSVSFTSNFWDVVNLTGTFGPGASGSALFDQHNRVVGSLSLGNQSGATADGYLQCPLSPPPSPTPQNALAFFTSLAAVWNSTSDPTGSASTIQQVLDPNNTATLVVDSVSTRRRYRRDDHPELVRSRGIILYRFGRYYGGWLERSTVRKRQSTYRGNNDGCGHLRHQLHVSRWTPKHRPGHRDLVDEQPSGECVCAGRSVGGRLMAVNMVHERPTLSAHGRQHHANAAGKLGNDHRDAEHARKLRLSLHMWQRQPAGHR